LDGIHAIGSDPEIIDWVIDVEQQQYAGGTEVVGWNLAAMSQEDNMQTDSLWREQAGGSASLGVESTGNDIESEAELCHKARLKVLDATANKISICITSKRWCNGDIELRRCQLGRVISRWRRSAGTAQTKAKLPNSIRRATDRMWNDDLTNLSGAEVWRGAKFAIWRAGATIEPPTDRDGEQANTVTKTSEMLR
jgi:hypothetical protein